MPFKISEKKKEYYLKCIESGKTKEWNKNYRESEHGKKKRSEYRKTKVVCECGRTVVQAYLKDHRNSQIHANALSKK
jgi:hypothetical protein